MNYSNMWKVAIVASLILAGCNVLENENAQTTAPVASNVNEISNLVPMGLASNEQIAQIKQMYESKVLLSSGLAKDGDPIEFDFDSTAMFEIQEGVYLAYTKQIGEIKEHILLTSFDDSQLIDVGIILKYVASSPDDWILTHLTLTGNRVGEVIVEDNVITEIKSYQLEDPDEQILVGGWWDNFFECLTDGETVFIGAAWSAIGFGQEAAAGVLLGCGAASTVITYYL